MFVNFRMICEQSYPPLPKTIAKDSGMLNLQWWMKGSSMIMATTNDFEDTRQCGKVSLTEIDIDMLCLGGWKIRMDVTQLFMSCLTLHVERITSNCSFDNKIPKKYYASFFISRLSFTTIWCLWIVFHAYQCIYWCLRHSWNQYQCAHKVINKFFLIYALMCCWRL